MMSDVCSGFWSRFGALSTDKSGGEDTVQAAIFLCYICSPKISRLVKYTDITKPVFRKS
jgi:hypothetical protein